MNRALHSAMFNKVLEKFSKLVQFLRTSNVLLVWIAAGIIFLPPEAFSHAGHSHAPGANTTSGSISEFANQKNPILLGLGFRAGYQETGYTGILPSLGLYWGDEATNLSSSYQLRFLQFLGSQKDTPTDDAEKDQEVDHDVKISLAKKIARSFTFSLGLKAKYYSRKLNATSDNNYNSLSGNPELRWQITPTLQGASGYEATSRKFPNGTSSAPPLGLSNQGDTIFPSDPSAESPALDQVRGIEDIEHNFYLEQRLKIAQMQMTGQGCLLFHRSNILERDYDGYRLTGRVDFPLWRNGRLGLEHQIEKRIFVEKNDLLNITEGEFSHKLTDNLNVSALGRHNLAQNDNTSSWEGYLEIRSRF